MANMLCSIIPPGRMGPIFIPSSGAENTRYLTLSEQEVGFTCDSRSQAVMEVMSFLRYKNIIKGWRDELYPLSDGYYKEPLLLVERAAAPFLGIQQVCFELLMFVFLLLQPIFHLITLHLVWGAC